MEFYDVGLAGQAILVRPERQPPQLPDALGGSRDAQVDSLVAEAPSHREDVLVERLLHVDERTLPGAVAEVLKRGDRNENVRQSARVFTAHPTSVVNVTPAMPSTDPSAGRSTR